MELVEAKEQTTDTEINEGLRCNVEKQRIDAVASTSNLSINSPIQDSLNEPSTLLYDIGNFNEIMLNKRGCRILF